MKAAVKETNSHTSAQSPSGMALQLLQKQPFIVWGASLVLVLLTGSIALKGLMSPGPIEPDVSPTTIAQTKQSVDTKQPQKPANTEVEQPSNLWLFGAIGLGCMAGSFLLAKRLEQVESQPSVQQKFATEPVESASTMTRRARPAPVAARTGRQRKPSTRKVAARRVSVPAVTVTATPTSVPVAAYPTANHNSVPEPVVTVVPDHETHPLDWGDASLADMMDLRKQRPLSHWL